METRILSNMRWQLVSNIMSRWQWQWQWCIGPCGYWTPLELDPFINSAFITLFTLIQCFKWGVVPSKEKCRSYYMYLGINELSRRLWHPVCKEAQRLHEKITSGTQDSGETFHFWESAACWSTCRCQECLALRLWLLLRWLLLSSMSANLWHQPLGRSKLEATEARSWAPRDEH